VPQFTLTAIPLLLREGVRKEHLEYITFIVNDGVDTHQWSLTNIGTFDEDFANIVPAANARDLLNRLRQGETVQFPGSFDLGEVFHHLCGASPQGCQSRSM
jgi:hypothetical protein